VVPDVWEVLDQVKEFSDRVRSGEWRGATGQRITNFVAIGIGGSFLGPLFVHTALRTDQVTSQSNREVGLMSEWFKVPVLKLAHVGKKYRGFEASFTCTSKSCKSVVFLF